MMGLMPKTDGSNDEGAVEHLKLNIMTWTPRKITSDQ